MNKLERIITYAYENIPYFNNVINVNNININRITTHNDLENIPIFRKEDIKNYGWINFISQEYLDDNYNIDQNLRIEKTSGTTGGTLSIPWIDREYYASVKNHWRYRSKFGVSAADKKVTNCRYKNNDKPYFINGSDMLINVWCMTEKNIILVLDKMNEFKPEWLYIQASVLVLLVKTAKKYSISFPKSIKYIEYIGEPVLPYYRKVIEEYINADTVNMYGCAETNGIAYECPYKNLHVLNDNVIVEIVDGSKNIGLEKLGNVCITGLHNTVMPMIRYVLNDQAVIYDGNKCKCGNLNHIIKLKTTRIPEFLAFDDIEYYEDAILYYPLEIGNLHNINDMMFHIKLVDLNNYIVTFIHIDKFDLKKVSNIFSNLMERYGLENINFTFTQSTNIDTQQKYGIFKILK